MKRNFPNGFISAFLEYNKNMGVPEKFLLWSAISGIAGCLERRVWTVYNNSIKIYPNLFVMLISDSGGRKSTASGAMMNLMYEHSDKLTFMSNQTSGASLLSQLKRAGDKKIFEFEGVSYKNSSVFSYSSEAANTIGQSKGMNGVQELLTDLYDNGDPNEWSIKKAWTKETLSGGEIQIFNPCLNLLYCSTPSWLMTSLGPNAVSGGFASRILFINQKEMHNTNNGMIEDDGVMDNSSKKERAMLIADLGSIIAMKGEYKRAKGFSISYNKKLIETNEKISSSGDMAPYYKRKMWYLLKLSQIIAADQSNVMEFHTGHFETAIELLEKLEKDMYWAFPMHGENKNLASLTYVWDTIKKKPRWEKREIIAKTFRNAGPAQLNEHLSVLQSMGKIRFDIHAKGGLFYDVIDTTPLETK